MDTAFPYPSILTEFSQREKGCVFCEGGLCKNPNVQDLLSNPTDKSEEHVIPSATKICNTLYLFALCNSLNCDQRLDPKTIYIST